MVDKKGYEVYIYDDCSVEVGYDGVILKDIYFENDLQELLNKQDRKIKELEAKVKVWKSKAEHMLNVCKEQSAKDLKEIYSLAEEVEQLKQSQNIIAIDELLGLRDIIEGGIDETEYINDRINDLKGDK